MTRSSGPTALLFAHIALATLATPTLAQLDLDSATWIDAASPLLSGAPAEGDSLGEEVAVGDFDGDGALDLAIGAPYTDRDAIDVGVVRVLWGTGDGTFAGEELLAQGEGLPGEQLAEDRFGSGSLVVGDFDADGYDDLVIGANSDDVDGVINSGSLTVVPGGPGGFDRGRALLLARQPELPVRASEYVDFATAAVGDFDGDGYDDLATGMIAPLDGLPAVGVAQVIYGSADGLDLGRLQLWHQGIPGVPGDPATNDRFGTSLAAGDFDGDGYDELAIGASRDDVDGYDTGSVTVLRGGANGLTAEGAKLWSKGRDGIVGTPDQGNLFGWALATGDVHGDGYEDLVVSDIHLTTGARKDVGGLWVLAGSADGLAAWHQLTPGSAPVPFPAVADGEFGVTLQLADLNGDGRDEVIAAAESSNVGVLVFYAAPGGFAADWSQQVNAATPGVPALLHTYDLGRGMAAGDFDGRPGDELVVGVPSAVIGGQDYAGAVGLFASPEATSCAVSPQAHCLEDGRFRAEVRQRIGQGAWTPARVVAAVADDSGLYSFYNPRNWELMLKVLDGCPVNGHFWTYLAATTNLEFEVTVTDTWTGATRTYVNPKGPAVARADTKAFACGASLPAETATAVPAAELAGLTQLACDPASGELCLLEERFAASMEWWTAAGDSGTAQVVPLGTSLSGLFWFFREHNWEVLLKMLDGCGVNGHQWVFAAATTNVGYRLRIRDRESGEERVYENPAGTLSPAIIDTEAFAACK
jgi:hypothetical protein